jgi:hypothetical protein
MMGLLAAVSSGGTSSASVLELGTPTSLSTDFSTRHQCAFWAASGVGGRMF